MTYQLSKPSKRIFLFITFLLALVSCGGGGGGSTSSTNNTPSNTVPSLVSITITPNPASVIVGFTQQLTATANYSDGSSQDITNSATWSSSNNSILTISNSGLATGISHGQVVIQALYTGLSASDTMTVGLNLPPNTWTWENGSDTINQIGNYGTKGIVSATNVPGARDSSFSWVDKSGNFWLFGGAGYVNSNIRVYQLDDLWKYDVASNQWTWMSGESVDYVAGNYGTKGVSSSSNMPGGRWSVSNMSWVDESGNLWLFGGQGYDSNGTGGDLNDLWKYNPTINQWTWMGGESIVYASGIYGGGEGQASSTNMPGARHSGATWVDKSGNFWLFGGYGIDANGNGSDLNDLWKYNPTTNQWTWVGGENTVNASGLYGKQGKSSSTNMPGARDSAAAWVDTSGNLWLFGGQGYDSNGTGGDLNDLWKYNPTTNQWTWVGGENTVDASGIYGTKGVASSTNMPEARNGASAWVDKSGNFWLFGGYYQPNDLWKYNVSNNQWAWMGGESSTDNSGATYGTLGVSSDSNMPGSRFRATAWADQSGNLWLFGGSPGYGSDGFPLDLNDLWVYKVPN